MMTVKRNATAQEVIEDLGLLNGFSEVVPSESSNEVTEKIDAYWSGASEDERNALTQTLVAAQAGDTRARLQLLDRIGVSTTDRVVVVEVLVAIVVITVVVAAVVCLVA